MKKEDLKPIAYLAAFIFYIAVVWSIVEFIIYLVKDKEFNWWSLGICITAFAIMVITSFVGAVKDEAKRVKDLKEKKDNILKGKTNFQQRLDETANKYRKQ